jgi:hypothetical protein
MPLREGLAPAVADWPIDSDKPLPWDSDTRRKLAERLD